MIDTKRPLPKDMNIKFIPIMEKIILDYYNLKPIVFWENKNVRKREYAWARQMMMYFQYNYMNLSFSAVGERYGKDHATALHARKVVTNMCETDKYAYQDFEKIYYMIYKAYLNFSDIGDKVCYKCGNSSGLSMLLWVDPNKEAIIESVPENSPGICEKCGETVIVTKSEYKIYYA